MLSEPVELGVGKAVKVDVPIWQTVHCERQRETVRNSEKLRDTTRDMTLSITWSSKAVLITHAGMHSPSAAHFSSTHTPNTRSNSLPPADDRKRLYSEEVLIWRRLVTSCLMLATFVLLPASIVCNTSDVQSSPWCGPRPSTIVFTQQNKSNLESKRRTSSYSKQEVVN